MKFNQLGLFLILSAGTFLLVSWQQPKFDLKASIARGKEIYALQCATCHMEEGKGLEGVYPTLAGAEFIKDTDKVIRVIRMGMRGPLVVSGVNYDSEMTGFELSDEEVADVANYIRNSWGNKQTAIKPEMVKPSLAKNIPGYLPY